jgi:hypothetical protein
MTPHVCDKELPCSNHFTIFLWVVGLLISILTAEVYATIDNRNRAVDEHKVMIQERTYQDSLLRTEISKNYSEIIQRLARIEEKISK